MANIHAIGLAPGPFKYAQQDIGQFIIEHCQVPEQDIDKVWRMYQQCEINTRYASVNDFALPEEQRSLYRSNQEANTEDRMNIFMETAPGLCRTAFQNMKMNHTPPDFTHLITVSCTGMAAPGLDVLLVEQLELNTNIQRTAVNFMGCYAMIHALKIADAICAQTPNAQVLLLGVELCSLHFQQKYSLEQMASSLLFGDGACAVVVNNQKGMFELKGFYSELILSAQKDMAWNISSHGFMMNLSAYVPQVLANNIAPVLEKILTQYQVKKTEIKHWAIHPGGKKILLEIEKALGLNKDDLHASRQILFDYGNMSSVTIIYLLDLMSRQTNSGEKIFGAGFGPGLTVETFLLSA